MSARAHLLNGRMRIGLAHVDVHGVGRELRLSHELRLVGRLCHHVPAVSSQHALRGGHSRGRHIHLRKNNEKVTMRYVSGEQQREGSRHGD